MQLILLKFSYIKKKKKKKSGERLKITLVEVAKKNMLIKDVTERMISHMIEWWKKAIFFFFWGHLAWFY